MENFKIENAKTRFFESKEHYLKFKTAWKAFHNGQDMSWYEDVDVTPWDSRMVYPDTMPDEERTFAKVKRTPLTAEHYLIYNLLRGYNVQRGFAPLIHSGRLNAALNWGGYERPWAALETAIYYVIRGAEHLENVNSESRMSRQWARKHFEELSKPFGGTLTQQMLLDLGKSLHELANYRGEFREFEVQPWKSEESFEAKESREDLKNPKRSLIEKLRLWSKA